MTNALATAAVFAFRAALRVGGCDAVLTRGAYSTELCVLPGRQDQLNQGLGEGGSAAGAVANFEILCDCYEINGEPVIPAKGDTLVVTFPSGESETFAAVDGPNRRPWDWADNFHQIFTCHYAGRG
jgi:hypothetical protein